MHQQNYDKLFGDASSFSTVFSTKFLGRRFPKAGSFPKFVNFRKMAKCPKKCCHQAVVFSRIGSTQNDFFHFLTKPRINGQYFIFKKNSKNKQNVMSKRDYQIYMLNYKHMIFSSWKQKHQKTGFLASKWPLIGKSFFSGLKKKKKMEIAADL